MTKRAIIVIITSIVGFCTVILIYQNYQRMVSDPNQSEMDQFSQQVWDKMSKDVHQANDDWTVYIAHGTFKTGWWLFEKEEPIVYVDFLYTGCSDVNNLVIKFGWKTIKEPDIVNGASIGDYIKSPVIPREADITWVSDEKNYHLKIKSNEMIELSSLE